MIPSSACCKLHAHYSYTTDIPIPITIVMSDYYVRLFLNCNRLGTLPTRQNTQSCRAQALSCGATCPPACAPNTSALPSLIARCPHCKAATCPCSGTSLAWGGCWAVLCQRRHPWSRLWGPVSLELMVAAFPKPCTCSSPTPANTNAKPNAKAIHTPDPDWRP